MESAGQGGGALAGGAHAGLNHARAFADAADADRFAAELEFHGDLLRLRVAGHDGFGGFFGVRSVVTENLHGMKNARLNVRHRHVNADTAGAADQDLFLRHVQVFRHQGRHGERVLHALATGAGVGVAGVHDDGLRRPATHALGANFHRRGANLIGGEHAGDGRGDFGHNEREVAFLALLRAFARAEAFDVTEYTACEKALRRGDGTFNGFKFCFHLDLNLPTHLVFQFPRAGKARLCRRCGRDPPRVHRTVRRRVAKSAGQRAWSSPAAAPNTESRCSATSR